MQGKTRPNARIVCAALAAILFLVPLLLSALALSPAQMRVHDHKSIAADPGEWAKAPSGTAAQLEGFQSHLPLVVVDVGGEEFHRPYTWDDDKGYQVAVDFDAYEYGTIAVIDNGAKPNRLADAPALSSDLQIRMRGFSSLGYAKRQYYLKLVNEDGAKNEQDMFGMGSDWEWILNLSYVDKTLLRNYMCMNIAGEILPYVPEMRFCELFLYEGGQYDYQGLYLFMESVKQSPYRIDIADYDSSFTESSYLLRRDRFGEDMVLLNNYGTREGLTREYLEVKYPPDGEVTDATVRFIRQDIDRIERALFAENDEEFLEYRDYINMQSFIDYFIINEFFGNYDSITHSVYLYKDVQGLLSIGPAWDFDQAIDNAYPNIMKMDSTAMHDSEWFRQMMRDGEFVKEIANRYRELREYTLSDERLDTYIDETLAFLGPAVQRDWDRWRYGEQAQRFATGQDTRVPEVLRANSWNHAQAVAEMKDTLHEHGAWLDQNIDALYQFSDIEPGREQKNPAEPVLNVIFGDGMSFWMGGILCILMLMVFFSAIILIQRE